MSLPVFLVVLFAALMHATWNAVVKGGDDKLLTTVLVTASASCLSALALPFLPAPAPASWPFIAGSLVFQIGYFVLVARIYHVADMGQTYPVMRGTAPLLVALASSAWVGERLHAGVWAGIGIICAGILVMAFGGSTRRAKAGVPLAFLSAFFIAGFTLVDALGVRRSGAPAAYTLWIFLLTGLPLALWAFAARGRAFTAYAAANWRAGLIGGFGTTAAYGLALWAMTLAPVAVVAALRETSILFATAISGLILKERVGALRLAAASIIVAGVLVLRLA